MFFLPLQLATGKLNPEKSNQSIDARLSQKTIGIYRQKQSVHIGLARLVYRPT